MMGLTFKENCPDLRNSKVADVVRELEKYGAKVDVYDPWVDAAEAEHEYGIKPIRAPAKGRYDAVVLAVAHKEFRDMGIDAIRSFARKPHVLYDIKYVFDGERGRRASLAIARLRRARARMRGQPGCLHAANQAVELAGDFCHIGERTGCRSDQILACRDHQSCLELR